RLNKKIKKQDHKDWMKKVEEMKAKYPLVLDKSKLTGPAIIDSVYNITKGDAIITTDVGQHQMWAAQFYTYRDPRQFITSGGLGTMGYGVGACIGSKMGNKNKTCINIAGDGCFRMNMNEIATATRYNIPIIQIVINNHVLGMVRQWQTLFYEERYSHTVLDDQVDFVKISEGLGAKAYKIETVEDFERALKEAIELDIPCVLDCHIHQDDKVFPMVAAGAPITDTFSEEDL
ncbi:MAG: acetolactate synthase large subunit, partial [Eubacterium sp.]|nr:acetolactate synthase large subunit [Eubacterium sp.]